MDQSHKKYKPVVLMVLDGWGESPNLENNAIRKAILPTFDKFNQHYPLALLQASGSSVGLPWGEAGNSEVGHISLGTGRIVYQNMPRIALSIQNGSFFRNPAFTQARDFTREKTNTLHLMGLMGQGSVHSYIDHFYALLEFAKEEKFDHVYVHAFTDGRDSPPTSGADFIQNVKSRMEDMRVGKIVSVIGRNWAMDRNNNWDRTQKAYDLLVDAKGEQTLDICDHIRKSYTTDITDEFIEPTMLMDPANNQPLGRIRDGDAVIFFNFREDRARQLAKSFVLPGFEKFPREKKLDIHMVTLTEYEKDLPLSIAFAPQEVHNSLGETLSKKGLRQLRIAETEKYAHVTYFFNGGDESAFPGEDHVLVPSKAVSSFDEAPEMSAQEITDKLIEQLDQKDYDFILVNYANVDMVGHTGNEAATIQAAQLLNAQLARLIPEILKRGGCAFITADHGNAEEIKNFKTGQINTEHSTNPVPLWFIAPDNHREKSEGEIIRQQNTPIGLLSDVAPTILDLMEIQKPEDMLGNSLLGLMR